MQSNARAGAFLLVNALGLAAVPSCIIPTPAGCNALDSEDECEAGSTFCESHGELVQCMENVCGDRWARLGCPSGRPYCVETGSTRFQAQCSTEPGCAGTVACHEHGYCDDSDDGCRITAAGCAASSGCTYRGSCGFDGFCSRRSAEGSEQTSVTHRGSARGKPSSSDISRATSEAGARLTA